MPFSSKGHLGIPPSTTTSQPDSFNKRLSAPASHQHGFVPLVRTATIWHRHTRPCPAVTDRASRQVLNVNYRPWDRTTLLAVHGIGTALANVRPGVCITTASTHQRPSPGHPVCTVGALPTSTSNPGRCWQFFGLPARGMCKGMCALSSNCYNLSQQAAKKSTAPRGGRGPESSTLGNASTSHDTAPNAAASHATTSKAAPLLATAPNTAASGPPRKRAAPGPYMPRVGSANWALLVALLKVWHCTMQRCSRLVESSRLCGPTYKTHATINLSRHTVRVRKACVKRN